MKCGKICWCTYEDPRRGTRQYNALKPQSHQKTRRNSTKLFRWVFRSDCVYDVTQLNRFVEFSRVCCCDSSSFLIYKHGYGTHKSNHLFTYNQHDLKYTLRFTTVSNINKSAITDHVRTENHIIDWRSPKWLLKKVTVSLNGFGRPR